MLDSSSPRRSGGREHFALDLATDVTQVGQVVDAVAACCFAGLPASSRTRFRLCTVVAEAVANAMVYGNRNDPSRRVVVEVELHDDRVIVAVTDEGDGFDPDSIPDPIDGETLEAEGGRGLFMIRRLADAVAFNERGKHHLDDAPPLLIQLGNVLAPLGALTGATLRLWQLDDEQWRLVSGGGADGIAAPRAPRVAGTDAAWLAVPETAGVFLEVVPTAGQSADDIGRKLLPVVQALLEAERTASTLTGELAARYEEIDLLYSIGELLGRARAVDEVAALILREVTAVVGAQRAGLRIYDESLRVLRSVAMTGSGLGTIPEVVSIDDPDAIVARAFRSQRITTGAQPEWVPGELLAVPIMYALAGQPPRVVGTLTLADRAGGGSFTREETKLVAAVATQIGAALENARLVALEAAQRRVEHELKLAHDLQVRLMPTPDVLRGDADVAVRSFAAESLGGDFYTFLRLGRGRVGVMLGDVSSHGFSAALIAAQVMAAAGIHASSESTPDAMLTLLRASLAGELESTEMYMSICYAVFDPTAGRISYSNAGHPYAFRVPRFGPASRLAPTSPPLGLADSDFSRRVAPWHFTQDLLVCFTDGLVDQVGTSGERYGEVRLLTVVEDERLRTPAEIVDLVFADLERWGGDASDDRTLLVMRM